MYICTEMKTNKNNYEMCYDWFIMTMYNLCTDKLISSRCMLCYSRWNNSTKEFRWLVYYSIVITEYLWFDENYANYFEINSIYGSIESQSPKESIWSIHINYSYTMTIRLFRYKPLFTQSVFVFFLHIPSIASISNCFLTNSP